MATQYIDLYKYGLKILRNSTGSLFFSNKNKTYEIINKDTLKNSTIVQK